MSTHTHTHVYVVQACLKLLMFLPLALSTGITGKQPDA